MSPPRYGYGTANQSASRASEPHVESHRRSSDAAPLSTVEHPEYSERDPFLLPNDSLSASPSSTLSPRRPRRNVLMTLWILPVVVIANLSRGMTMAPRIELYTQVSCNALHPAPMPANTTPPLPIDPHDFQPSRHSEAFRPLGLYLSHTYEQNATTTAPSKKCLHDPSVQSRAANIQATLGTIAGVLSIITAGYWGQISDAYGRKVTLGAILFGMTFHDIIYIAVSVPNSIFSRHAWGFLIIGPIIEGSLGGLTTLHAAQNSYLADCSPSDSRSTIFAYYQGAIYVALALGPQLAGIFLRALASEAGRSMFYLGLALDILCLIYTIGILPETVTREMMRAARRSSVSDSTSKSNSVSRMESWMLRIRHIRDRLLSPLVMFAPHRRPGGIWDLNLMFLVIAQFTHILSVGVAQVKYLYAQHTYAWSVKQLGHYISFLWTLRAFHLLFLLPMIVHFVKPRATPLSSTLRLLSLNLKFDYRIAQFSIFIDTSANILTLIAPTSSQALFVAFTSLSSFTAGVNPAIHSLAVSFLQARDNEANVGQMFGGMSMLQAVAHTIQPMLFGLVYSETAATYPKAIFALAAGLLLASVALLTLLRTNQTPRIDTKDVIEHGGMERVKGPFSVQREEEDCH